MVPTRCSAASFRIKPSAKNLSVFADINGVLLAVHNKDGPSPTCSVLRTHRLSPRLETSLCEKHDGHLFTCVIFFNSRSHSEETEP